MRTTLILNDDLVTVAKRVAAEKRTTLSAVVNDALRVAFMAGTPRREPSRFHMPVFRGEGDAADTPPAEFARLVAEDDIARYTP